MLTKNNMIAAFLEMCDLAIMNGANPKTMEKIAARVDLKICTWCKERGNYPSVYLKLETNFKSGVTDAWLDGSVCDECLKCGNKFEY